MNTEILSSTDREALKEAISSFCEGKKIISCSVTSNKQPDRKEGFPGTELSTGGFAMYHTYFGSTTYVATILYE